MKQDAPGARRFTETTVSPAVTGLWGLPADDPIATAISEAILEQRLRPGTKLPEEALARVFGGSRAMVRQALQRLAYAGIVSLSPHRTAAVATPTLKQARDIYEARMLVESQIVADVAMHCTAHDIRLLRQHLAAERGAELSGQRSRLLALRSEFHVLIAGMGGNEVLKAIAIQLIPTSALLHALYAPVEGTSCATSEHDRIVDLLAAGDADGAMLAIRQHHNGNLEQLQVAPARDEDIDLASVFAPIGHSLRGATNVK
jgi:DNA-binding GntR family transcriptional regulator